MKFYSLFNRLALACATSGLAIATVLTFAHTSKVPLPCGGGNGCERVAQDSSSMYHGIPVSVFGMAAYVALIVLSLLRIKGIALKISSLLGLLISLIGTVTSGFLTYYAITKIQATCVWCIGSGVMMVISTIAYLATPKASEGVPDRGRPVTAIPWAVVPVLIIGAYAFFGHVDKVVPPDMSSVQLKRISFAVLEGSSHPLGPKTAPVTIVEFADLMCPACREMHQRLLMFLIHNRGKVRLMYHHFPLIKESGHEDSQYAANLSEQLNPDDFWGFVSKVYSLEKKPSRSDLDAIFASFHGKRAKSGAAAAAEVDRDMKIGADYGVKLTPTYILFINGMPESVASSVNIKDVIKEPKYAKIFAPPRKAKQS